MHNKASLALFLMLTLFMKRWGAQALRLGSGSDLDTMKGTGIWF